MSSLAAELLARMKTLSLSSSQSCSGSSPVSSRTVATESCEAGFDELAGGEVHRHPPGPARVAPLPGLHAGRAYRPRADRDDHAGLLGELEEVARSQEAARRMFPTQERLDADDRVAGELVDRLVMQDELAPLERGTQIGFELEAPSGFFDEVVVEVVPVRAALPLGAVHRGIGVAQQRGGIGVFAGFPVDGRDADAQR